MSWQSSIVAWFANKEKLGEQLGEWDTAGGLTGTVSIGDLVAAKEGQVGVPSHAVRQSQWERGWWIQAMQKPAHKGRIGGTIVPKAVVVHTTDMMTGTFNAQVRAWQTKPGAGNAAHFLIGRHDQDGVVQFAPITRNANHAGGPTHGWWSQHGKLLHPNVVAVGIELDNAGRLTKKEGRWYYKNGTQLLRIPDDEVSVDEHGRGWHTVTTYQRDKLAQLLSDLQECLTVPPYEVLPGGDYKKDGVPWAEMKGHIVGHATLNPDRKSDPGPFVTAWLKAKGWSL